jgi:hypothetical protein
VPFAERIKVPTQPLRLRRDVPRLINIIRLVAWLHQHTRERDDLGRIEATEDDFRKAIEIVGDSFARAWKALTLTEEAVYEAITEHVSESLCKHGFKRLHLETALKKAGVEASSRSVKDALYTLSTSSGFLESDGKRGATGSTYTVAKGAAITSAITLSAHSPIHGKSGEFGIGKAASMNEDAFAHSTDDTYAEKLRNRGEWARRVPTTQKREAS